jgi:hypothetical protein
VRRHVTFLRSARFDAERILVFYSGACDFDSAGSDGCRGAGYNSFAESQFRKLGSH